MNIQELTAYINQNIRNNGVQAITGDLMQNVLNSIVATLSDGANIVPGSVTRGAIAPGAVDNTPTAGSNNLITSTAVAAAIKAIQTVVLENKELTDAELQNIINTGNELIDAVNERIPISEKGMYNGVATLGEDGRIPASQLPGFVDEVKEGYLFEGKFYRDAEHTEEIEPQGDKIYIDLSTDKEYRWGGTKYAQISESLALGETPETAYAGSKGKQNAEDIERLKTGKQATLVSGENIKTLNGKSILGSGDIEISGGGGGALIPITWVELVALRDAGQLVVGGLYRLTDYEIMINTSGIVTYPKTAQTISHPYDIILTAIAPNILSEECGAMLHEGDEYYSVYNRDLSVWKLWYCIDNDTERFAWAVTTENGGKGVVYRMIDDNNIDCGYDFKQIKIGERLTDSAYTSYRFTFSDYSTGADLSVTSKCVNNVTLEYYKNSWLNFPAVVRISGEREFSFNYIFGDRNYFLVISDVCRNNRIFYSSNCKYKNEFSYLIVTYASGSTFDKVSSSIIAASNASLTSCYNNIFTLQGGYITASNCRGCVVYPTENGKNVGKVSGYGISIGGFCENVDVTGNGISIGGYSKNITIKSSANGVSIGNNCSDITLPTGSYGVSIGNNCSNINIKGLMRNCYIGNSCSNINSGVSDDSNNKRVILYGVMFENYCSNITIFEVMNNGFFYVQGVSFRNKVSGVKLTSQRGNGNDHYYEDITFLQGGRDATTPMEISLDDYATDAENTSPARIACYNSAGEYKIFALADLLPA